MPDFAPLPIDDVLDEISLHLEGENRLVLAAPPGAGKTTKVPLYLLESGWTSNGRIILVEPRRIAARRAAERMASMLGEKVGATIGLRSRFDTRVSKDTRIEVVTDGVLSNQLIRDPDLPGVSAILFDEFHERGLESDLGLTLALESQSVLRDDLRILVMSATLDTSSVCGFLGCELIESEGRAFPVDTRYVGKTRDRIEDQIAKTVRTALSNETGSLLVFLPGAGEINRTAERLRDLPSDVHVCPLYGALSPQAQDEAIHPAPKGSRKVVLATDIAESSLTIEGVRVVIDAGQARVPVFRPGMSGARLETRRATRANIDQRRGRAGRTEPGVCYRLWHEEENRGLPASPEPEILATDLTSLILRLAAWGNADPTELAWLTPPPNGHVKGAMAELQSLGFLDEQGALSEAGKAASRLPMAPRFAKLITGARNDRERYTGGEIAAILSEPGLGGKSEDLSLNVPAFRNDRSSRARSLFSQVQRWSGAKSGLVPNEIGPFLLHVWPGRLVRKRGNDPYRYQGVSGDGYKLPENSGFTGQVWLILAEASGMTGSDQIIRKAIAIDEKSVLVACPSTRKTRADIDFSTGQVRAREVNSIGAIELSERPIQKPGNSAIADAVLSHLQANGFSGLAGEESLAAFLARMKLVSDINGTDPLAAETLIDRFEDWLRPSIEANGLSALNGGPLVHSASSLLEWSELSRLKELVPEKWTAPSGRNVSIVYLGEQAPLVSVRVQDLYGLKTHPTLCDGRVPITLSLLSPAQRPVAITKNLPGFWSGGYADMRKDMKGRYPKHDWPEDPANASPPAPRRKSS